MDEFRATDETSGPAFEERAARRFAAHETEIRRLHQRNQMLGIGMAVTVAFAVVSVAWTAGVDRGGDDSVVEAERIVLVDSDGRPRGEWSVDEEGHVSLKMLDMQQRERMSLSVRDQGYPGLSLSNAQGERRVALGLLPDETTSLVFADGAGVPRAVLGLVRGDAANLLLADADGVSRIGFGLDGRGLGSVLLPDESDDGDQ